VSLISATVDLVSADVKRGESKFTLFEDRVLVAKFRAMQNKSNKISPVRDSVKIWKS